MLFPNSTQWLALFFQVSAAKITFSEGTSLASFSKAPLFLVPFPPYLQNFSPSQHLSSPEIILMICYLFRIPLSP